MEEHSGVGETIWPRDMGRSICVPDGLRTLSRPSHFTPIDFCETHILKIRTPPSFKSLAELSLG